MEKEPQESSSENPLSTKRRFQIRMTKCLLGSKILGSEDSMLGHKLIELDHKFSVEALEQAIEDKNAKAVLAALDHYTFKEIEGEYLSGDALIAVLQDPSIDEKLRLDILKTLLEIKDAKPNFTGETEESPLHVAALTGNLDAIFMLLRAGAVVNLRDENGITPLFGAAWCGNPEVMKVLMVSGADARVADNSGSTPLHVAAMKGNPEIVKTLIEAGAEINGTASIITYDDTPLHLAAWSGDVESIKLLVKAGSDINAEDHNSHTPQQVAETKGHSEAAQLLKELADK